MLNIYITGHKGFIGAHLIESLESLSNINIVNDFNQKINYCDWEKVSQLPAADVYIHLAAVSFVPKSFSDPRHFYDNNFNSTLNILEKARIEQSHVVFLSTYVYGAPDYLPINESHKRAPLNPYTQSKIFGEDLCEAYNRDFGLNATVFRLFNVYGKNQKTPFFIPTIIEQLNQEQINLRDSRPRRDFIYISDVVEAITLAVKKRPEGLQVLNLGSGVSVSIKEVVSKLVDISSSKAKVSFSDEVRQGEVLDTCADISKAYEVLNWKPQVNIDAGLRKCLNEVYD